MHRLIKVAEGIHKLESTSNTGVYIDATGEMVKLAKVKSNLYVALVKAPVKVFKQDHHAYHKLLRAESSRALRDGDTIASNQWLHGAPITASASASIDNIRNATLEFTEWLE